MGDLLEMQAAVKAFCTEREWDRFHTPKDLAIGISTEAAELLELFRFKSAEEVVGIVSSQEVRQELADVLIFVLRFAERNDIDLRAAFEEKLALNRERYPVEKAKGVNKKYTEL